MSFSSNFTPRETHTASTIINTIVSQPITKITKIANTSGKKLLKHINNYIYAAIAKKYNKNQNFTDFVYTILVSKYNIKSIAERKFQELITSCLIQYNNNQKISLFLRCLRAGSKYNLDDISSEGCEMYIKVYDYMISNNIGVIIDTVNPLNIINYPAIRAIECIKNKFESFYPKATMTALIEQVEKININDQANINKSGMVNIDEFVEVAINVYEKYVAKIKEGASICVKIISDYNYLTRGEAAIILRHLCPNKCRIIFRMLPFDEKRELDVEEFTEVCINNGILQNEIVLEFFALYNKNTKEILEYIHEHEQQILESVRLINEDTLSVEEWQNKFEDLNFKLRGCETIKYLQLWHLLYKEIEYLNIL